MWYILIRDTHKIMSHVSSSKHVAQNGFIHHKLQVAFVLAGKGQFVGPSRAWGDPQVKNPWI